MSLFRLALWILAVSVLGCGTSKGRLATEQMIVSDAIDQSIAELDFRMLAESTVYLDTTFIKNVKGVGFANANYIISSLRQQLVAADCRLQEKREDADYIVEPRVGVIGIDANDIVFGVPASSGLSVAASLVPGAPPIPALPEISLARKEAQMGASKIAVFAYHRESGRPVWQSGITRSRSTAQDYWVLGAGPFQRGSIYQGTQFAGQRIQLPDVIGGSLASRPPVTYFDEYRFDDQGSRARVAQRTEPVSPNAEPDLKADPESVREWLAPLQPKIVTPLESRMQWR